MQIWHLLDSRGMGGIEKHVLVMVRALREAGYDARIVLLENHGRHILRRLATREGLPLACVGGARSLWHALGRRDDVLLHTHGYKAGLIGRAFARLHGRPVVSTFHNGDVGSGRMRLYTTLDRWTGPMAAQIAVSDEIARRLRGKVTHIDNFVPVSLTAATTPSHHDGPIRVGFVGRLSHEKGIDRFCALAKANPTAVFHVFGDGPLRVMAQELAAGCVTFHGMVPDMSCHWQALDLLCMPSRQEGLPLAALEAMADGVPVLGAQVGGLPDLIEHRSNGWLTSDADIMGLQQCVSEIFDLGREKIQSIGQAARQTIIERYNVETAMPQVLAVYRDALQNDAIWSVPQFAAAFCSSSLNRARHTPDKNV